MHTKPMADSDGEFNEWVETDRKCPKCGGNCKCREWHSFFGGYVDHQYQCQKCGFIWWIDGSDS